MPFRSKLRSRYRRRGVRRGMLNPRNVTYGLRSFKSRGFTARLRLRKGTRGRTYRKNNYRARTTPRITRTRVAAITTPADSTFARIPYKNYLTNIIGDGVKTTLLFSVNACTLLNPLGGNALIFPGQTNLGNMYSRYYVAGSTISIKMWNPTTTDFLVVLIPQLAGTTLQQAVGNEEGIWSLPRAKTTLLLRGSMNNSNSVRYMKYYMSTKKMFPDDDPAEESQYQANLAATVALTGSPATNWYWNLFVLAPDGSVIPNLIGPVFEISMWQHTRFTRVRPQGSTT